MSTTLTLGARGRIEGDKAWSVDLRSVARPLWIPAFAGMTVVMTVMTVVLQTDPTGYGALKPKPPT